MAAVVKQDPDGMMKRVLNSPAVRAPSVDVTLTVSSATTVKWYSNDGVLANRDTSNMNGNDRNELPT